MKFRLLRLYSIYRAYYITNSDKLYLPLSVTYLHGIVMDRIPLYTQQSILTTTIVDEYIFFIICATDPTFSTKYCHTIAYAFAVVLVLVVASWVSSGRLILCVVDLGQDVSAGSVLFECP